MGVGIVLAASTPGDLTVTPLAGTASGGGDRNQRLYLSLFHLWYVGAGGKSGALFAAGACRRH